MGLITPTKVCSKCGVNKKRTAEFFWKSIQAQDGFLPKCKVCGHAEAAQKRQQTKKKPDSEAVVDIRNRAKLLKKTNLDFLDTWTRELKSRCAEKGWTLKASMGDVTVYCGKGKDITETPKVRRLVNSMLKLVPEEATGKGSGFHPLWTYIYEPEDDI